MGLSSVKLEGGEGANVHSNIILINTCRKAGIYL